MNISKPVELTKDLLRIGETFDHIMTTDVTGRGSISLLYNAARRKIDSPLALTAAKGLADRVKRGDFVFFLTGFLVRSQLSPEIAESDGPPGVAALARSIYKILGGIPVVVVEDSIAQKVASIMEAAGFFIVPADKASEAAKPSPRASQAAVIMTFPNDSPDPLSVAIQFLEQFKPSAIVSVERGGANAHGVIHSSQGMDVSNYHARTDLLVKYAYEESEGPLTIAVGDGGNEVGMGTIAEELAKWLPYGTECQCPCKGGIIPETKTDILVTASVSNWGAYAIAGALALLAQEPEAGPNPDLEERMIRRCATVGFIDGPTGEVGELVDGMPGAVSASVACLINQTVIKGLNVLAGKGLWAIPEYKGS